MTKAEKGLKGPDGGSEGKVPGWERGGMAAQWGS